MKTSIYVDGRRPKSDGSKTVYLRFKPMNGSPFLISTGICCTHEPVGMIFPPTEQGARAKTARLTDLYTRCEDYVYRHPDLPVPDMRRHLTQIVTGKPTDKVTLEKLFEEYSRHKTESYRQMYERTLKKILEYDHKASLDTINKRWLEAFSDRLKKSGANVNGVAHHMRNLRAVFNYAIDEDLTGNYPFRKFRIKHEQTRKRDLTIEQLRAVRDCDCEPFQEPYRDFFMLIFYLCGINIGDLLLLKRENVNNGRIEYHRRKTNKYYSIKIEPEAQAIIDKYKGKDWLLSPMDTNTDYHQFMKRMNQQLKKLGMSHEVGKGWSGTPIFSNLSTYYARHSWASIAAEIDIPIDVIAQALGHSTPYTTTDIYVNRRLKKIDEANRKIIDYLNNA